MRRRAGIELARKYAMSPRTLPMPFACLDQAYKKYGITIPGQLFNVDASRAPTRNSGRGKEKASLRDHGRSNATDLAFASNAEHLTLMPVVSADVQPWPPVVILSVALHKVRKKANGK